MVGRCIIWHGVITSDSSSHGVCPIAFLGVALLNSQSSAIICYYKRIIGKQMLALRVTNGGSNFPTTEYFVASPTHMCEPGTAGHVGWFKRYFLTHIMSSESGDRAFCPVQPTKQCREPKPNHRSLGYSSLAAVFFILWVNTKLRHVRQPGLRLQ